MPEPKFRKLHRKLAPLVFLPLALTAITGIIYSIADEWLHVEGEKTNFLLAIHTGALPGLEKVYALLNGLGLIALIVTGLSMTRIFRRRPNREAEGD